MTSLAPAPDTTAVIILGASEFPLAPQFEAAPQFARSAAVFHNFMLDRDGFNLPSKNLLPLFDTSSEQPVVIRQIANFLLEKKRDFESNGRCLSDVIFYYVGHGEFDTSANST